MTTTEVLAPAGGPDSLAAAVRAGADAVYLGADSFSARAGAHNFTKEELAAAVRFCHARGVRVHLAVNTLLRDEELPAALELVQFACSLPVDAVLVQDTGLLYLLRRCCPELPLHASTQLSVHTPAGVRACMAAGFSRVVLSRELSLVEIREIHEACPDVELESFVHGALCMSVSGQCWFSAILGGRSGNRGQCAQPCRLPFTAPGGTGHDLSLKDLSMIPRVQELRNAGVCSYKIEGRLKRPEYVAAAAHACRLAIDGQPLPPALLQDLQNVFSRSGFTTGYPDGRLGREMFGTRQREDATGAAAAEARLRELYRRELSRVPVQLSLSVCAGKPARLTVCDRQGHTGTAEGAVPQPAKNRPITPDTCREHLEKTGGTPFCAEKISCTVEDGLALPASALNALRREALSQLLTAREQQQPIPCTNVPLASTLPHAAQAWRLRLRCPDGEVPPAACRCESVTVPCTLPLEKLETLREQGLKVWLELPRGMFGAEAALRQTLQQTAARGFTDVWAGTLNSAGLAKELGLTIHGGFSLNVTNSAALRWYTEFGLADTELSFELTLRQAAALTGSLPRGTLVYGRLPLMLTRNCPLANAGGCRRCMHPHCLTDRKGVHFPVVCFDHRGSAAFCSEVLNSVPLSLLGRRRKLAGLDFGVVRFTTETPAERRQILELALADKPLAVPLTRGLSYRGVL